MAEPLTKNEWTTILESLWYAKRAIEESTMYPDAEFKKARIQAVTDLMKKCHAWQKEAR